eukprot:CAMPEP_0113289494 /NCGR_PEP_ID=MMETSP0008_2-20120614/32886_1 /TAXON_ID=97485 /ORGANISM="Prymnesium parvum" /LENGTH=128 /DNA_ID=CAMNT_0000141025 /DNA_START=206 /DNA_END=592 /DNA_ORIENTATION=+ /assembly_acc=CAM_ASM_000153
MFMARAIVCLTSFRVIARALHDSKARCVLRKNKAAALRLALVKLRLRESILANATTTRRSLQRAAARRCNVFSVPRLCQIPNTLPSGLKDNAASRIMSMVSRRASTKLCQERSARDKPLGEKNMLTTA